MACLHHQLLLLKRLVKKEISGQVFEEIIRKFTTGFNTLCRNMYAHIHF